MKRCGWAESNPLETKYHDEEWGVPVHDDRLLFEILVLEGMQSGLSWATILAKRSGYQEAVDNFDAAKIATYGEDKIQALLQDERVVRNKLKVNAIISNAKAFLKIQKEHGSFDTYIWSFVKHEPIINNWQKIEDVPAVTPIAEDMSKSLKKQGFKFVGPTTCYAFMQAVGMVNDHLVDCFRYHEVQK
ncbi:DNA-3-methyladenine glycosylase I [Curvivirga aplysinae]|uniref:DNA-3-methyladenine glycosylase I n=1 Tax=Curvivirga aplysinae TaxID=2529852 RepID=UPI0012BC25BE|nr:DNA-3-methyladenine glycosylase I [Curvivirga aplysinae]MTI09533.1 DNA-3-methyladenine glycosylase I [Curvivirga aplysinae]